MEQTDIYVISFENYSEYSEYSVINATLSKKNAKCIFMTCLLENAYFRKCDEIDGFGEDCEYYDSLSNNQKNKLFGDEVEKYLLIYNKMHKDCPKRVESMKLYLKLYIKRKLEEFDQFFKNGELFHKISVGASFECYYDFYIHKITNPNLICRLYLEKFYH